MAGYFAVVCVGDPGHFQQSKWCGRANEPRRRRLADGAKKALPQTGKNNRGYKKEVGEWVGKLMTEKNV